MNTLRDGEEDATDTALYGWLRCGVGDMPTLFSQVSAVTQDGHLYGQQTMDNSCLAPHLHENVGH